MKPATPQRMRWVAIAWIASLALSGAAPALDAKNSGVVKSRESSAALPTGSPEVAETTWYVRSLVATEFGVIMTHYWSKGSLFRAETVVGGHPITTIVNGSRYYVYDSIRADGAVIERNAASVEEDATRGRPFARELRELLAGGGEKVSEGFLEEASIAFEVYQLTNDNGRRRVQVTKTDPPLPIQIETFVRETGSTGLLEYAGWQRGFELRDSFFEPPNTIVFEQISYLEYTSRFGKVPIGPAPVYYRQLLHGSRKQSR
jgi:hypothetical protein